MRAWIGLGGNREDSAVLLIEALRQLSASMQVQLLRCSRLYRTRPWGVKEQPDFVNAVAEVETALAPLALLGVLLGIEEGLGRARSESRWGPRCIDLDLLVYDEMMVRSDVLELPHPRMHMRAFVLVPLLELEPEFRIPGLGFAADYLSEIDPEETAAVVPQPLPSQEDRP